MVAIERKIRDKRIKFGRVQTKKLEEWIRIHEEFTYPKAEDLEELVGKTGLSDKQIRVWFTNHRNRKQTRAEICLSRIRYSLQSKSFQRRSKKLKDKLAKETSRYYLSKYYCLWDTNMELLSNDEQDQIAEKCQKFLQAWNYWTCDVSL